MGKLILSEGRVNRRAIILDIRIDPLTLRTCSITRISVRLRNGRTTLPNAILEHRSIKVLSQPIQQYFIIYTGYGKVSDYENELIAIKKD